MANMATVPVGFTYRLFHRMACLGQKTFLSPLSEGAEVTWDNEVYEVTSADSESDALRARATAVLRRLDERKQ